MAPPARISGIVLVLLLTAPMLAGCTVPTPADSCDAETLVRTGTHALARSAHEDGGLPPHPTAAPDPRTTAWGLLAAGLARRTGHEGAFQPTPHIDHLKAHLPALVQGNSPIDSAANNLSLARAALQAWGRPAEGIPLEDPDHAEVDDLAGAWEARYDDTTGRYGIRLNEHLFGAFAAWLFEPPSERLHAMARHTQEQLNEPGPGGDPTTRDAWWAAYARAALGPGPEDTALAERLEAVLDRHQDEAGGVRGFAGADHPDASTTAAALLAWQRAGEGVDGAHVAPAIAWLCGVQRDDGLVPFSERQPILLTKTTSEVVIALALLLKPVPWQED